jgi:hypothetical protein
MVRNYGNKPNLVVVEWPGEGELHLHGTPVECGACGYIDNARLEQCGRDIAIGQYAEANVVGCDRGSVMEL